MPAMTANTGRRVTTLAARIALNWPFLLTGPDTLRRDLARAVNILAAAREDDAIEWEDAAFVALVLARYRGHVDQDCPTVSIEMDTFDLLGAAVRRLVPVIA